MAKGGGSVGQFIDGLIIGSAVKVIWDFFSSRF